MAILWVALGENLTESNGQKRLGNKLKRLTELKVYAVEVAGTIVFVVFVCVEAVLAIRHLIEMLK